MKHLHFTYLLAVLLSMAGAKAWSQIEVRNEEGTTIYYSFINDKKELAVTWRGGIGKDTEDPDRYTGNVVIPAEVTYEGKTYSVTKIGFRAFYGCRDLTSVTIPNSVTSIGGEAFYGCRSLTSVTIPNSVTSIPEYCFYGCSGLTSVIIPNSVTSIGIYAFGECRLKEVHISDIAAWCKIPFRDKESNPLYYAHHLYLNGEELKELVVPNSVTNIGEYAFYGCCDINSLTIPNSVTKIGDTAFRYCSGLKSIQVEDGNMYYDSRDNCNALIETASNTLLQGSENTIIPNSVKAILDYAFYGCKGSISVESDNSITRIGNYAFYDSGLISLFIPNSVSWIGSNAFCLCKDLASITVEEGNPLYDSRENCNAIIKTSEDILLFGCMNTIIPNSVTSIGGTAFYGCSGLTTLSIPNSVTSIGYYAFSGCSGLTSLYINSKVVPSIAGIQESLSEVILGDDVEVIDRKAFSGCTGLTSITIPNSVTRIRDAAFYGCTGLTSLKLGNSVEVIEGDSFNGCIGLTSVTFPGSVKEIWSYAFEFCDNLISITFLGSSTPLISKCNFTNEKLKKVVSFIKEPRDLQDISFTVHENDNYVFKAKNATLYVPVGTKEKYMTLKNWSKFKRIIEMSISPMDDNDEVIYGSDSDVDNYTMLDGNILDNIYYNISDDKGEYNSTEGCIVVRKPTGDDVVSGISEEDLFGEALKDAYTGIIFMVQPGSGVITVNAETTGGMTLKVKVGENPPTEIELKDKIKARFPYSVDKASYVYIYAGGGSAGAKAMGKAASNNGELKIYGIEWSNSTDGIKEIIDERLKMNYSDVYNLNGQKVDGMPTKKGVYIKDGKKVLVK